MKSSSMNPHAGASAGMGGANRARPSAPRRSPRFMVALAAAKATQTALRIAKRKGGQLPGVVAEAVCPDFLARSSKPGRSIFVTGTNGKTTTTNLIDDLLVDNGFDPIVNRAGSNIANGVESALIEDARLTGSLRRGLASIELDELSCRTVLPYLTPDLMLVTNLYQDNFLRDATPEFIFDVISRYVPAQTHLVLNADDLISCRLAPQATRRTYYSLGEAGIEFARAEGGAGDDMPCCPKCGGRMRYRGHTLLHLGRATCESCGFTNPPADYEVTCIDQEAGTMTVRENRPDGTATDGNGVSAAAPEHAYRITAFGIPNLYNLLAAIATLREFGIPAEDLARSLNGRVGISAIRYTEERVGGKELVTCSAKTYNGTGATASLRAIQARQGRKALILVLNDFLSKDPMKTEFCGWYYLIDGAPLADDAVRQIIVFGYPEQEENSREMELRLRLAGVPADRIAFAHSTREAGDAVDLGEVDSVYALFDCYNGAIARESIARVRERLSGRVEGEGR